MISEVSIIILNILILSCERLHRIEMITRNSGDPDFKIAEYIHNRDSDSQIQEDWVSETKELIAYQNLIHSNGNVTQLPVAAQS